MHPSKRYKLPCLACTGDKKRCEEYVRPATGTLSQCKLQPCVQSICSHGHDKHCYHLTTTVLALFPFLLFPKGAHLGTSLPQPHDLTSNSMSFRWKQSFRISMRLVPAHAHTAWSFRPSLRHSNNSSTHQLLQLVSNSWVLQVLAQRPLSFLAFLQDLLHHWVHHDVLNLHALHTITASFSCTCQIRHNTVGHQNFA